MDAQIQERLARQGAENLRLGDEVKALKRKLRRLIPVGAGGEPLLGEEASVRVEVVSEAALDAAEGSSEQHEDPDPDGQLGVAAVRYEMLKTEVEALKRRKDSPSAAAMERMSGLVEEAQADVVRLKEQVRGADAAAMNSLEDERDTFHDALAAIRAEWDIPDGEDTLAWLRSSFTVQRTDREKAEAMLRDTDGQVLRVVRADLDALQQRYNTLETRERHQGRDLVNVQAAYANLLSQGAPGVLKEQAPDPVAILEERDALRDELYAIREEFNAPEGESLVSWLECGFETLRGAARDAEAVVLSHDWRRDLWVKAYLEMMTRNECVASATGFMTAKGSDAWSQLADLALEAADKRFDPETLDTSDDDSEG